MRVGAASNRVGVNLRAASFLYSRETLASARIALRSKPHKWSCSRLRQRDNATYCHGGTRRLIFWVFLGGGGGDGKSLAHRLAIRKEFGVQQDMHVPF